MEEEADRAEATRVMTLIAKPDLSDRCSKSLIQLKECSDEQNDAVMEQETERIPESCGDRRTEVCELPPGHTGAPNNSDPGEDQTPASPPAGNNEPIQQDGPNTSSELPKTDHRLEAEETPDCNAASESLETTLTGQQKSESSHLSAQQSLWGDHEDDEEIVRRAREEGCVHVVFPGSVTQDSCCRFVCELLKCILYQKQQLPMTYDQMVFFQKQQYSSSQADEAAVKKSLKAPGDLSWKRCQQTLQALDEVLGHMEALFSLSYVPRVLFMLGGSTVLPTELYEINMESLKLRGGDRSLRTSSCLRRLFRTLFVADLLSDVRPVRLMLTTVMALGHRDCGIEWFKPKVNFRVPTKVTRRVIALASDASLCSPETAHPKDWTDYIWFQAPVTIKGFCK